MRLLSSLRNRLVAGLLLPFLLFLMMAVVAVASLRSLKNAAVAELQATQQGSQLANDLVRSAAAQVRAGDGYFQAPSPDLRALFLQLGDTTHALRRRYRLVPGLTPRDQAILNRMAVEHARVEVAYATAHALWELGRTEEALTMAQQTREPADTLIAQVDALMDGQTARGAGHAATLLARAGEREAVVWTLFAVAALLGFGSAMLTVRSIDAPLQRLIEAARRFGQGDLRPTPLGEMPAELATLSHAMGNMGHRLRGMIEATIEEARSISGSASDLSAMSEEVAASSHEIVRAIAGVTTGAEQQVQEVRRAETLIASILEHSAQDVAATERVVALGESTRTLTGAQGGALSETGSVIEELRTLLQRASTESRELRRTMDAVAGVAETATQLANQSEVLALNAAVEASHHEGGGAGFNAVADETRRLADAGRGAAEQVRGTVDDIRSRTEALTGLLHGAGAQLMATETALQRSAVAMQEIARLIEAMRDIATRVARSAEESRGVATRFGELRSQLERSAADNVAAGESVTAAATQQSEATDDIAKSAAGLLEASDRLGSLVAGFQT